MESISDDELTWFLIKRTGAEAVCKFLEEECSKQCETSLRSALMDEKSWVSKALLNYNIKYKTKLKTIEDLDITSACFILQAEEFGFSKEKAWRQAYCKAHMQDIQAKIEKGDKLIATCMIKFARNQLCHPSYGASAFKRGNDTNLLTPQQRHTVKQALRTLGIDKLTLTHFEQIYRNVAPKYSACVNHLKHFYSKHYSSIWSPQGKAKRDPPPDIPIRIIWRLGSLALAPGGDSANDKKPWQVLDEALSLGVDSDLPHARRLVLFYGEADSGKTMTIRELVYRWSISEACESYDLVVAVMSEFSSSEFRNLSWEQCLLKCLGFSDISEFTGDDLKCIFQYYKVLMLLDDSDNYVNEWYKEVMDIKKCAYAKGVLVTARSTRAFERRRNLFDSWFEIDALSSSDVWRVVRKAQRAQCEASKYDELITVTYTLHNDSMFRSILSRKAFLNAFVEMLDTKSIFRNRFKWFKNFILRIIQRKLKTDSDRDTDPRRVYDDFVKALGQLAFASLDFDKYKTHGLCVSSSHQKGEREDANAMEEARNYGILEPFISDNMDYHKRYRFSLPHFRWWFAAEYLNSVFETKGESHLLDKSQMNIVRNLRPVYCISGTQRSSEQWFSYFLSSLCPKLVTDLLMNSTADQVDDPMIATGCESKGSSFITHLRLKSLTEDVVTDYKHAVEGKIDKLSKLLLTCDKYEPRALITLLKFASSAKNLTTLHLIGTPLQDLESRVGKLLKSCPKLVDLRLTTTQTFALARIFSAWVPKLAGKLKKFALTADFEKCTDLNLKYLKNCIALKELRLSHAVSIGTFGTLAPNELNGLAYALPCMTQLQKLTISSISLDANPALAFAKSIQHLRTLYEIHLRNCNLEGLVVETLVESLKSTQCLSVVDLGGNNLASVTLHPALEKLQCLKQLRLDFCKLSDLQAGQLARWLSIPDIKLLYIQTIYAAENGFKASDKGFSSLLDACRRIKNYDIQHANYDNDHAMVKEPHRWNKKNDIRIFKADFGSIEI